MNWIKEYWKSILVIFIIVSITIGGSLIGYQNYTTEENPVTIEDIMKNAEIVILDGCEYYVYSRSVYNKGYSFMSHKGNCKNPIHKCKEAQGN
jgi:hypothetical protein